MSQLAIRCHRCAPVSIDEVDEWLHEEVERLQDVAPHAALRLLHLSQALPTGRADVGWLIELDAAGSALPLDEEGLAQILRDLRLLGLQPTLFKAGVTVGPNFVSNGADCQCSK